MSLISLLQFSPGDLVLDGPASQPEVRGHLWHRDPALGESGTQGPHGRPGELDTADVEDLDALGLDRLVELGDSADLGPHFLDADPGPIVNQSSLHFTTRGEYGVRRIPCQIACNYAIFDAAPIACHVSMTRRCDTMQPKTRIEEGRP